MRIVSQTPHHTFVLKHLKELTHISLYPVRECLFRLANHSTHHVAQVEAGLVDISYIDTTVKAMLRTKFSMGLFESMCQEQSTMSFFIL